RPAGDRSLNRGSANCTVARMIARWRGPERLDPAWRDGLLGPGTLFELVEADVRGVRLPVFAGRHRSVVAMLDAAAAAHAERPFLIGPDRTVTFASAPTEAARIAAVLAER